MRVRVAAVLGSAVVVRMTMVMTMVPRSKGSRRGGHKKEQCNSQIFLHALNPIMKFFTRASPSRESI